MSDLTPTNPAEKAAEEAVKKALEFLDQLVSPTTKEVGAWFGDKFKFIRWKQAVDLSLKAKQYLDERGVKHYQVEPKTLLPILESGSLENDPTIQDMWSRLLVAYASGRLEIQSLPHILKELSPMEAHFLFAMYTARKQSDLTGTDRLTHGTTKEEIRQLLSINENQFDVMSDNLMRLNLIQPVGAKGALVGKYPVAVKTNAIVHITALGEALISSCTNDENREQTKIAQEVPGPSQDNIGRLG